MKAKYELYKKLSCKSSTTSEKSVALRKFVSYELFCRFSERKCKEISSADDDEENFLEYLKSNPTLKLEDV